MKISEEIVTLTPTEAAAYGTGPEIDVADVAFDGLCCPLARRRVLKTDRAAAVQRYHKRKKWMGLFIEGVNPDLVEIGRLTEQIDLVEGIAGEVFVHEIFTRLGKPGWADDAPHERRMKW